MIETKISVVIPVKNDEKKIGSCIEAVFNQSFLPFEVIIVDGHSIDNTIKNAQEYPVKILFENYGTVGGARQVGLENSGGEYIAFTDSDCIPEKMWIDNLFKEFKEDIVGVGGGIKNIGEGLWEQSIALALDSFLGSANSVQDRVLKKRCFVPSISGCNCMYRKKDLLDVGGYNVTYFMNEDTDINKRLLERGKILYTPDAVVLHNQNRDIKGFCKRMYWFGYGRGFNRLFDLQVIPPISVIFLLLLLIFTPFIVSILIFLYVVIILIFSMSILIKSKNIMHVLTIPLIFIMEHLSYSIGFWYGTIKRIFSGDL